PFWLKPFRLKPVCPPSSPGRGQDRQEMAEGDDAREGMTSNEIARLEEAFQIWDREGHNMISWQPDFKYLWRSIGQNPTKADIERIYEDNKTDNGYFTLDLFMKIYDSEEPRYTKDPVRPEELIEAFKTFDKDGTGMISVPQLRYMMQCLGDPLEDEEADQFIDWADKEKAGIIKYEDLVDAMFDRDPKN
ncbi:unnamed protein product, partial [Prorocentrum cordatum]